MQTVALDTNIITKILSGDHAELDAQLERMDNLYVPWAVYGELLAGVTAGSNPNKYVPLLEEFLDQSYVVRSSVIGTETVPFYAEIYRSLRQKGTPVSPNDMWIAAECASQGLALFTLDKDFDNIPQILLFK